MNDNMNKNHELIYMYLIALKIFYFQLYFWLMSKMI